MEFCKKIKNGEDLNCLARTILASNETAQRIIKWADSNIYRVAIKSSGFGGKYESSEMWIKNLYYYIRRKERMNFLIDETKLLLKKLNYKYMRVLELRNIRQMEAEEVAKAMGITTRHVFRIYKEAVGLFNQVINSYKDSYKLINIIKEDPLLIMIYEENQNNGKGQSNEDVEDEIPQAI